MRIMIKGGVWKNTEDEILKAAVMKYGKNQWARVASLLNRKTAKQCKARWYEWLDPSIKKTEWTRDEEEKLLHLAKLYPCQWRTVAPLVGRTAAQCMERYERLLDEAQREITGDAEKTASAEEVRRLRPGEIDPTPETRPARPDPVDMDEDEKEMLSEARARLANTRGKKAKRKARESQMDEARRLASSQKRRELKAAGIYTSRFNRSKGGKFMDYDSEVPFQKLAPAGFYDPSKEKRKERDAGKSRSDADFEAIRLDRMEEERRDAVEKQEARSDSRKKAKLMKANLPLAIEQLARLNDPGAQLRRSELALPAPQVTDAELEEMARLGTTNNGEEGEQSTMALLDQTTAQGAVERALASQASRHRTPMRADQDAIGQEARNAVQEREMQSPFLGETQPEKLDGTGYSGSTPMTQRGMPTPSSEVGSATPLSIMSGNKTPGGRSKSQTPMMRDALGLNEAGDFDDDASAFSSRTTASSVKRARTELKRGLETLPEPKYAYEVEAPEAPEEEEEEAAPTVKMDVVDAAERDLRQLKEAAELEAAALARRSSAVRRGLPRPRVPPTIITAEGDDSLAMIRREMGLLLNRDAMEHPVGKSKGAVSSDYLEHFEDAELAAAKKLVDAESSTSNGKADDEVIFAAKWEKRFEDCVFFPGEKGAWAPLCDAPSAAAVVASYKASFEATRGQMAKGATRAARLEERLEAQLDPLVNKAAQLRAETTEVLSKLDSAVIESACFDRLRTLEHRALPPRLETAKKAVQNATAREKVLQAEFVTLRDQYSALYAKAANHVQNNTQ